MLFVRFHMVLSCSLDTQSQSLTIIIILRTNASIHLVNPTHLNLSGDCFSLRCFTPDFIDQSCSLFLCYNFVAMLVASSAVLALKSYMSDSIDCFIPAEFKVNHDNWIKYADNYCWVRYKVDIF